MRYLFKTLQSNILLSLAICAFGIQFATTLQMANMSSVYKFLGARTSELPYLWLAAPLSGLIIQPLVGQLSDVTVSRFGKRSPYILIWGIGAALALVGIPWAPNVYIAAFFLLILDCSINGCTETLRALTADITKNRFKTKAFATQTIFAGLGSTLAAGTPWLIQHFSAGIEHFEPFVVPSPIKTAFYLGAVILVVCVLYTLFSVHEKSAKDKFGIYSLDRSLKNIGKDLLDNLIHIPKVIRQFYVIQLFCWMGLYCLWLYFSVAISQHFLGLPPGVNIAQHIEFQKILSRGTTYTEIAFGIYQIISMIYAWFLPTLTRRFSTYLVYGLSLLAGSLGILLIAVYQNIYWVYVSMIGVGMMWGSIMTIPYALLAKELPRRSRGVYLGIFNITITIPQIICALFIGYLTTHIFKNRAIYPLCLGGLFIFIAAFILLVKEIIFQYRAKKEREKRWNIKRLFNWL